VVRTLSVLVRSDGEPTALAGSVRQAIERVDPALPVFWVSTLEEVILQQTQGDAIMARVMAVLGIVALLLSVIGVYGVMAYNVQQRIQEVGIRMALGAEARDVVKLMMRQGVVLAGVGMTLGLGLALLATRGLSNFLFGVSPFDLGIFAGVTGVLLGAAVVASFVPALRSARVDPNVALRLE
jgi:ABC-type antimicrobial peptide transport system permease subunit